MTPAVSPSISVILPAYNVSGYIGAAIASVQAQGFADFEVLVVDDESTDDTRAQALVAIGDDPRFRLITQQNRGLSGARNTGLGLARAPLVAFLDGDDRFDPDFLGRMHGVLHAAGADWVACGLAFCTPDGARHPHSAIHGQPVIRPGTQPEAFALDDWTHIIPHFPSAWNKLYRRDFIGDIRFDPGVWYEDHGFFHRLAAKGSVLHHLSEPLYRYTLERDGQITRADSDRVFDQITVLETSARIFRDSGKPGAGPGLARLATRLFCERLEAIRDAARAQRFREQAAAFFARHGLAPDWSWDPHLPALQACSLSGRPAVSICYDTAVEDAPAGLLPDPASPLAPFFELVSVHAPAPAGGLLIDLSGVGPVDHAILANHADQMLRSDIAAVLISSTTTAFQPHITLTPDTALDLTPASQTLLIKAAYVRQPVSPDPQLRLAELALSLAAARVTLACAQAPMSPPRVRSARRIRDLVRLLDDWQANLAPRLPPGGARRLLLRMVTQCLVQERASHTWQYRLWQARNVLNLWKIRRTHPWTRAQGVVDADTPPLLRRIFRVHPAG